LAEPTFDPRIFARHLATRRLGRTLVVRGEVDSTNDLAWDALAEGSPDGAAFVADAQRSGRGREGRSWHTTPGKALALSILLGGDCGTGARDRRGAGVIPLAAGLALLRGLEALGLSPRLKWPNDLMVGARKLSGILCESRRAASRGVVAVIGVGVNVSQRRDDFPPELRERATSLEQEGCATRREAVAAEFLNALEPLWDGFEEGGSQEVLDAWRARASLWGHPVTVHAPGGDLCGVATDLDDDGGLVLRLADGRRVTVLAGSLDEPALERGS
jgi:BirA family biotin operon repressor/biotin-[acetyl-CoA-carboxylase] ligase